MLGWLKVILSILSHLGDLMREKKIEKRMELEDDKRVEAALDKWAVTDFSSVSADDAELFTETVTKETGVRDN